MTDTELQKWWPELGVVVMELRCIGQSDVADLLVEAVLRMGSSSEILGGIGVVLRDYRPLRFGLSNNAKRAWDAVMSDVYRAFPSLIISHWIYWLTRPFSLFCHQRRK
ncbi:MAG: hypothetical protein NTW65_12845 [Deltaproteobacteria bacterium]|nr:hypothetical protein [Deltaproteobacteria bacterium]